MNFEKLSTSTTLLANLGVLAGIIFLAIEINQNNRLLSSEASFNVRTAITDSLTLVISSPDLAGYMTKVSNGEELAPEEDLRLQYYFRRVMRNMEWAWMQVPEDQLPMTAWANSLREPFRRKAWDNWKYELDPEFVTYMENRIAN